MVIVNLTLFVELGLFLLFLWAMQRWVLMPLLAVMDERRAKMAGDADAADAAERRAKELENEIFLRRREEREVEAVRKTARAELAAQRDQFPELAESLASAIAERVATGGTAR